jgi:hypothetical protein
MTRARAKTRAMVFPSFRSFRPQETDTETETETKFFPENTLVSLFPETKTKTETAPVSFRFRFRGGYIPPETKTETG